MSIFYITNGLFSFSFWCWNICDVIPVLIITRMDSGSSWKRCASLTGVEWIQDDVITLFTTDGLVRIGGSIRPSNEVGRSYQLLPCEYTLFFLSSSNSHF